MLYKFFDRDDYERWHDDDEAQKDYEKYKENISKVKSQLMEWMEDVEEARYFVEEIMKDMIDPEETGVNLDAEKAKEDMECAEDGMELDDKFIHLDPEGLENINVMNSGVWFKKLELMDEKKLTNRTCRLDKWQRKVVDIGIGYARDLRKFYNGFDSVPS